MTTESETTPNIAFIIGNGPSRLDFDLELLIDHGTIYGCNALYRDFTPHFLVAIDPPIIEEIKLHQFPSDKFIVPPHDEQYESASFHKGSSRPRSNAGTNAILEAIKAGHNTLLCLGFDFLIANEKVSTANIYDETACYESTTRATYIDNLNRAKYLEWICKQHQNVNFIMIFPRGPFTVHSVNSQNISGMYYDEIVEWL